MEVQLSAIMPWITGFLWPFVRLGALFMASPIFGARTVPVRVRVLLAALVALLVQPALPAPPPIDPASAQGLLLMLQQVAVGLVMGLILQVMFAALVMAGHVLATAMGLGFASAVDPQNGVQVTVVGQFYLILASLLFMAMDGHLVLIGIFADSFSAVPVGTQLLSVEIFWNVVLFAAEMFVAATLIALPAMAGVLLVNVAFGVITRASPQLNIFAMGFPITILAGFVLMLLSLPVLMPLFIELFSGSLDFMRLQVN